VSGALSALEIEDLVTVRDAIAVVQRLEMVRRIADEIAGYVVELGTDGRLLALQLEELMVGVDADRALVIRDYLPSGRKARTFDEAVFELDLLSATDLIDLVLVGKAMGYPGSSDALDAAISPRGFRLLAKVPRLPGTVVDRLIDHFGSLQRLLGATVEDLQAVEGVGDARARGVREGLSRLAEASILERYV
jgi:diadenylate cyclase